MTTTVPVPPEGPAPLRSAAHLLAGGSSVGTTATDVVAARRLADGVAAEVPSFLGLSVSLNISGVPATGAATEDRLAALDGVQYLSGGPCVEVATGLADAIGMDDALSEPRWEEYALAAAADGVRSSLSLGVVAGEVTCAVNLYASEASAFTGREQALRALLEVPVDGLLDAAPDLTPSAAGAPGPRSRYEADLLEAAVACLAASRQIGMATGRDLLDQAAARAHVDAPALARALLHVA